MTYGSLFSSQLIVRGDYQGALAKVAEEIAGGDPDPEVYFNQGQAYAGLGQYQEAVASYARALAMDASDSALDPAVVDDELFDALRSAALADLENGGRQAAVATLERYRELAPQGRHLADIPKWIDHFEGVQRVWYRDRV